mgnify:CR=1 FL=1|jgi:hypothetical protein
MAGSVNDLIAQKIVRLYVSEQQSIPQIAGGISWPRSRVRTALLNAGVKMRTRADGLRLRGDVLGKHIKGKPREFTPEWKANIGKSRRKWGEENAKGKSKKPSGYIEITRGPNKGRGEHVAIMEDRLGRRLLKDECVHHIDGNRANNSPDNLALMTRGGHTRLHQREKKLQKGKSL